MIIVKNLLFAPPIAIWTLTAHLGEIPRDQCPRAQCRRERPPPLLRHAPVDGGTARDNVAGQREPL